MKSFKYNTLWQLVRVNAREKKDIKEKILYVLDFLKKNPNWHNYDRVKNWLAMTQISYKKIEDRNKFERALLWIDQDYNRGLYRDMEDNPTNFSLFDKKDLMKIYKDLTKRKYGFQIKKVPQDHIDFMERLKRYLWL